MSSFSPARQLKPRSVNCCSNPNLEWVFTSTGDGRFPCSFQKQAGDGGKTASETDIFRESGRK